MILTGYVESNSCEAELYINMSGVHNLMNKIKKVVLIIVVARYVKIVSSGFYRFH